MTATTPTRPPGIVVCGPVSYFRDDVRTTCARCWAPIVHRPHVPADYERVCLSCAVSDLRAARSRGQPLESSMTPETVRELRLYHARTKGNA